jgi:hypothetical protein
MRAGVLFWATHSKTWNAKLQALTCRGNGRLRPPLLFVSRLLFTYALAQKATVVCIVRPAAKIATWLMAAPFVALSLGTIAADGMAISNVEIRAGALCTAGFILAAVGCVSLLKRQK